MFRSLQELSGRSLIFVWFLCKGKVTETSDIDLLIAMSIDSMKYFELIKLLRERVKKKDLLDIEQLDNNPQLVNEILNDFITIYKR